jgi:hypothetical protein
MRLALLLPEPDSADCGYRALLSRCVEFKSVRISGPLERVLGARFRARGPLRRWTPVFCLQLVAGLVSVIWTIVAIVGTQGDPLNYLQLAWGVLLVAYPLSMLMHSSLRVSTLLASGVALAGMAVFVWQGAQAPADWANYFAAAWFLLLLLAMGIASRWARTRQAQR